MPTLVSQGSIVELRAPWTPAFTSGAGSLQLYGDTWSDYAAIWRTQPNVRTVIDFLARNIAQLGIKLFERVSATEREERWEHPLAQTLRRPNPFTTRYRLIYSLIHYLGIYDDAFWIKVRGEGDRLALVPVPTRRVRIEGENWLRPERYVLVGSGQELPLLPEQVVHFHGFDPEDLRHGYSPMETIRRIIAEEAAAGEYREQFWKNAGRMETVVKRPRDAPRWSPEAKTRFLAGWKAMYSGSVGSGSTAILEEGMEVERLGFNAQEAQYLEARMLSREEVCSAFHVQPAMIGILRHANFANVSEQRKMLYQDTLPPRLVMIEEEIELQLLPDFADLADAYVEFNVSEKLKGGFEEQATVMRMMVGGPVMTRDEGRARLNLPPKGGDASELIVPLNVTTGGQADPSDVPGVPAPEDEPKRRALKVLLARHLARQRNRVVSELGAAKGVTPSVEAVFDADRWQRELVSDLQAAGVEADGVPERLIEQTGKALTIALMDESPSAAVQALYADMLKNQLDVFVAALGG